MGPEWYGCIVNHVIAMGPGAWMYTEPCDCHGTSGMDGMHSAPYDCHGPRDMTT